MRSLLLMALGLTVTTPAQVQEAAMNRMASTACARIDDSTLPPELAAWGTRAPVAAAADAAGVSTAALTVGRGADAKLRRNGEVTFPVLPAKPGGTVSYGGLLGFEVRKAGDYQVSLGSGAWIEVVDHGRAVASTRHAPGPACTTLKKTVVFPLAPGAHLLEVSGNGAAELPVMITRVR